MPSALIVHASRHGSTAGIADRIGSVMRIAGIDATVASAADLPSPESYDVCVVGAGVYMGSWLKEGTDYLDRYASVLASRPVWLFSSGPLPGSTKEATGPDVDPIENALGPKEGPGSGGRRKVDELAARINVREHKVFQGAFNPKDPPKAMAERLVRMMPAAKGLLPSGDFRQWALIEQWARGIAAQVRQPVAAG
jgi:menaquinone-dependent protoporphyrinogen oxidase